MALRAFWQHHNRHGQVDRIEVHDSEFSGTEFELCGDSTGFSFRHDEITSESNEKLINIQANRVQIGKLDFRPRIESTAGETLLADIRDSDNKRFHIEWYKDGNFEWAGWVTTRIFSYPEKATGFFAHIRATDFEILQGIDYPLSDTRQTFIDTFSNLFSELPVATPIRTATSWVEENVTAAVGSTTYDFLAEIYHETKALRNFARTGDETDQPITKWEALEHVAEPALLIRQMNGHIYIDQITELADPTSVNETTYDSTGVETTSTANVDRRQTGYTSVSSGTPAVKITSQNDTYPAIKRATIKFNHRTQVSGIKLGELIELTDTEQTYSQTFFSDGTQLFQFISDVEAIASLSNSTVQARYKVEVGGYWYNADDAVWETSEYINSVDLTFISATPQTSGKWAGSIFVRSFPPPTDADGVIALTVYPASADASITASDTDYINPEFKVINSDIQGNSTSIDYRLTQQGVEYPTRLMFEETWMGDGPVSFSPSALRYGLNDSDITNSSWQRRGSTAYRNYHENLLKEVLDMGRSNMRKLQADIWGAYDPSKVLDYNGSYFFYAGGKYDGVTGKWQVTLMELDLVEDATDTFEDIPKFTDETGSGTGSTSTGGGGGGGGGGLDQSTADARYFRQSNNLSEGDAATIRQNIGTVIGSDVQAWSATLDNLSANLTATATELNRLDGDLATVQANLGLKDGSADLDLNSLDITSDNADAILFDRTENANINNTYRIGVSSQDAFIIASDEGIGALARYFPDGAVELYGDTDISGALSANTLNTGQGDNELYPMNQAVRTSDDVDFQKGTFGGGVVSDGMIEILNNEYTQWNHDVEGTGRFRSNYNGSTGRLEWEFFRQDTEVWETIFQMPQRQNPDSSAFLFHKPVDVGGRLSVDFDTGTDEEGLLQLVDRSTDVSNILTYYRDTDKKFRLRHNTDDSIDILGATGYSFDETVELGGDVAWTTPTFNTGFSGNGSRVYEEASEWHFETDVGFFRSALFANEFIINQILATQGSRIASPGRGKVETIISSTTGSEVLEFSDPEGNDYPSMAVDDVIMCLNVRNDLDTSSVNVLEDDGGVIVKRFVRIVDSVSGSQVSLDTIATAPNDAGSIAEGDVFVVIANASDPSRQNILYETVIEPNAPYTALKVGLDGWTAYKSADNLMMKYGNLNQSYGYTSDTFGMAVGSPSGEHATFDASDGVRFIDGSGTVGAQFNSSVFTIGTGDNFVEFDVDAGTGNIELDTFNLESTYIRVSDLAGGLIRVGEGGSSNQAGLNGESDVDSVAFWAGASHGDRNIAPVWIRRNGSFSLAGGSITGTSTNASIDVDDLFVQAGGSGFKSADFYLNSTAHRLSLGAVFSADGAANEVELAGFTADSDSLDSVVSGNEMSIRSNNDGAPLIRMTDGDDVLFVGQVWDGSSYIDEMGIAYYRGSVSNPDNAVFRLSNSVNKIAGFSFNTTQFESTNLSGGGDGSFTTDGILINSGGYISAPNFYLNSDGDGALGDLDIEGNLNMTTSGLMSDGANWQISGDNGFDFVQGDAGINSIQWHESDFNSNADIFSEIYSYRPNVPGIGDVNRLVLRAVTYNSDSSDIFLTSERVEINAETRFNGLVRLQSGETLRVANGATIDFNWGPGTLQLPVHTDASRPSNPDPGQLIFNSDANGLQFSGNGGNWIGS